LRDGVPISGATSLSYTVVSTDDGHAITFELTPVALTGTSPGYSVRSGSASSNSLPVASNVTVTGIPLVGQVLMGQYVYSDSDGAPENASTFRWLRDGAAISGATSTTYTVVKGDSGHTLVFEVTPVALGALVGTAVQSAGTLIQNSAPTATNVTITGIPNFGQVLAGQYAYNDVDGDLEGISTFRWLNDGAPIGGATSLTYTVASGDVGHVITFEVTPVAVTGVFQGVPVRSSGLNVPITPTITWPTPAPISYGTALSTTQLDASADVPGTFSYAPLLGAVLPVGSQTLNAIFLPTDTIHYTTATAHVVLAINPAASGTALVSSLNPSFVGQSVTLAANVSGVNPTGTVAFTDAGTAIAPPVSLTGAIASLTTGALAVGSHSIVAMYSGDANNLGSASSALQQLVNSPVVSAVTLTSSLNPSFAGQSVTITANVTGLNPTGTVTFADGGTPIGSPFLATNGSATWLTSALTAGSHNITASYSGDVANMPSASSTLVQTVRPTYTITDLGSLSASGGDSLGYAINDNGQVTGQSFTYDPVLGRGINHAFVISPPYTTMLDLGGLGTEDISSGLSINNFAQITGYSSANAPKAFLTSPPYISMIDLGNLGLPGGATGSGINDSGHLTGEAKTADDDEHAFLWDGTMHDLGTLGGGRSSSGGNAINASGQITGFTGTANGNQDAFLYNPSTGAMTDLGDLGGGGSEGFAINASGQITGEARTAASGQEHAFFWDGAMHDLGTMLGGQWSVGYGISAAGAIVGASDTIYGTRAFLYTAANGMVDLNTLVSFPGTGWLSLNYAYAINDLGQITGWGTIGTCPVICANVQHAFVLTPPPPAMGALINNAAVAKPASGTADAVFGVTFYNTGTQPVDVNFTAVDGTAVAGTDYVAASGTLTFAPGVTTQLVTVQILGGAPNSSNLSFTLKLSNASNGSVLAIAVGTILVPALPIDYTISASPSSLSLGASADASSNITLHSLNGVSETAQLTAAWNGTAPAGVTFTLFPSNVTIPSDPDSALATITVTTGTTPSVGTFDLDVTAKSASGVTKAAAITVTITPPSPPPPPPPNCCTSAGPFVNPAPGVNMDIKQDGMSPSGKYQVVASGGAPSGLANIVVKLGSQTVLTAQAAQWGFSPDNDRFVTSWVQTSGTTTIHYVALYDLTRTSPQAPIWTSSDSTVSARIQFSPSGHYLFYTDVVGGPRTQLTLVDAHTGTVEYTDSIAQVGGAPIEGAGGESEDSFGTIGWGFGPNDTRFVYAYLTDPTDVSWNLVNLGNGPAHAGVKNISLPNWTSDYWQFSSCGEVIAVVRQPGQQYVYVDLYNTKDGSTAGAEAQIPAPVQTLQLHTTSTAHIVTVNGATNYTLASLTPECNVSVTAHSPVDILLVDPQGRRSGFDPATGLVLNEIPGGSYTGVGTEPETITVPYVMGTYTIEATGLASLTAPAPYRLSIATANQSDTTDEHDIAGIAASGSLQEYVFTVDDHFSVTSLSFMDTTPPSITPNIVGTAGSNGWYASNVALSWNVSDGESPIQSSFGCAPVVVNTDTGGTTFTCTATSAGGTASNSVTVKRDTALPTVACGAPDEQWHASDVSIGCVASDAGSGLAAPSNANFALITAVPADTETANASTGLFKVCDVAGNCVTAGPISGNMIDKKPPAIALTTPANGAIYSANQAVTANYSCSDGGSGLASCAGTAANGARIDTTPDGISTPRSFTVNSSDKAGNAVSQVNDYVISCHYVAIGISPSTVKRPSIITVTADVMSCAKISQSISVKFELTGPQGSNSCGNTKTVVFTTPPFTILKGTSKAISFPFIVPKTMCEGTYSVTSTALIEGTAADVTETILTVQ